jgi:hypothetical protein
MLTNDTEAFREKHVSVTLYSSQIPYGLAWGRIRASALTEYNLCYFNEYV